MDSWLPGRTSINLRPSTGCPNLVRITTREVVPALIALAVPPGVLELPNAELTDPGGGGGVLVASASLD